MPVRVVVEDVLAEPAWDTSVSTQPLLTTAADAGARGIVLEGTGAGNVPVELLTTIDELTTWDIPVVVASRARTTEIGLVGRHGGVAAARRWFEAFA